MWLVVPDPAGGRMRLCIRRFMCWLFFCFRAQPGHDREAESPVDLALSQFSKRMWGNGPWRVPCRAMPPLQTYYVFPRASPKNRQKFSPPPPKQKALKIAQQAKESHSTLQVRVKSGAEVGVNGNGKKKHIPPRPLLTLEKRQIRRRSWGERQGEGYWQTRRLYRRR